MKKLVMPSTSTQFKEQYYYKKELSELCRRVGLPMSGTKAELNSYIEKYLSGTPVSEIKAKRPRVKKPALMADSIRLDTKVVGSGFVFNNEARKFFAAYFGTEKFSFKKEMAIVKRKAEQENDTEMTVADLIRRSLQLSKDKDQIASVSEERTYQWNNFVRSFFLDPATVQFTDRLKVAGLLWGYVKNTKQEKKYSSALLETYADEVEEYLKLK
ncbi:hypothetical protein FC19_GL000038 [Liquorilactobacillus aquaticus DSM 21051]|uniref:SAP domain-containing protein n=1 Tax=Liquorilactobacillus aquaticus DSM 21051 TaxID=1423725 RepID=A0A0R2D2Y5_9LACO|nr:SAP domain-containing protein [Liquorilactobacillus aquaticus]KRM94937.1 hypothetical protein FC19_GL000038 [Liquorilactobacillus aquaticus DSM 21051]